MIQLHIYGILAILEILLVVSGLAVYLYVRNRRHSRTIDRLNAALRDRPQAAESQPAPAATPAPAEAAAADSRSFSDFLRQELDASSRMLGTDGADTSDDAATDDADGQQQEAVRQMLAARHQFLQLELDAQAMEDDPESQRRHLVEQMQSLLATFTPQAEAPAVTEEGDAGDEDVATLGREQQLESQLDHLRTVVSNQQDVMRELRELLETEMGESEEMRDIIARLQDAEASSLELERSLEVMGKPLAAGDGSNEYQSSPDSDMLRNLVGSQQQTINNLQNMLRESVGEKEASMELRDAMEKIQRSNQELGTCVMVLEDENSLLRDQIQSLQSQLEEFMGGEETRDASAADAQTAAPDESDAGAAEPETPAEPEAAARAALRALVLRAPARPRRGRAALGDGPAARRRRRPDLELRAPRRLAHQHLGRRPDRGLARRAPRPG